MKMIGISLGSLSLILTKRECFQNSQEELNHCFHIWLDSTESTQVSVETLHFGLCWHKWAECETLLTRMRLLQSFLLHHCLKSLQETSRSHSSYSVQTMTIKQNLPFVIYLLCVHVWEYFTITVGMKNTFFVRLLTFYSSLVWGWDWCAREGSLNCVCLILSFFI